MLTSIHQYKMLKRLLGANNSLQYGYIVHLYSDSVAKKLSPSPIFVNICLIMPNTVAL